MTSSRQPTHGEHKTQVPSSMEEVVQVAGLRNAFGEHVVHDRLDLTMRRGEVLGVVGASGTGKSVLLRAICGLLTPSAGSITVLGRDLETLDRTERRHLERRTGVLFQNGALFSSMTVAENVKLPLREHYRLNTRLADEVAVMKIQLAGLPAEAANQYPAELSGGMRKRASLARALALDPELLFLDEPTAGLDPVGAAQFDELIRELTQSLGLTVFMVTHDLDSLHTVCDRVAVLAEKRVLIAAPIDELLRYDHAWIKAYFHGPRGRAALSAAQRRRRSANPAPS